MSDHVSEAAKQGASETAAKVQQFVESIHPWLRERSRELAHEMRRQIDEFGVDEGAAYEAAIERLVQDLREELDQRAASS
jgi:hypothetical protein